MLILFLLLINGALIDAPAPYWIVWMLAVLWHTVQIACGDR